MLLFLAGNSWFTHLRQLKPSKIGCKAKYFVDCCSNFFPGILPGNRSTTGQIYKQLQINKLNKNI